MKTIVLTVALSIALATPATALVTVRRGTLTGSLFSKGAAVTGPGSTALGVGTYCAGKHPVLTQVCIKGEFGYLTAQSSGAKISTFADSCTTYTPGLGLDVNDDFVCNSSSGEGNCTVVGVCVSD